MVDIAKISGAAVSGITKLMGVTDPAKIFGIDWLHGGGGSGVTEPLFLEHCDTEPVNDLHFDATGKMKQSGMGKTGNVLNPSGKFSSCWTIEAGEEIISYSYEAHTADFTKLNTSWIFECWVRHGNKPFLFYYYDLNTNDNINIRRNFGTDADKVKFLVTASGSTVLNVDRVCANDSFVHCRLLHNATAGKLYTFVDGVNMGSVDYNSSTHPVRCQRSMVFFVMYDAVGCSIDEAFFSYIDSAMPGFDGSNFTPPSSAWVV
jgi:hypothetical protein